ncbi:MAG TPA: sigma 54-interacting transcriptional regulator [Candidatus Binatia bacterium]|nr:sigma 54-interacting transcriptional regulator [Candidatus Binatia bacterium]
MSQTPAPDGSSAERRPLPESEALLAVIEATARTTGERFLEALVRELTRVLDARHAFVAEVVEPERTALRTRAWWSRGPVAAAQTWPLRGSPCEAVSNGEVCQLPAAVLDRFPDSEPFGAMRISSFLGAPLVAATGAVVGMLAVFDERRLPTGTRWTELPNVLAARAAGELERIDIERRLRESEERFRNLFDEAPIAYVYEETSSRFVSANRSFIRLLGLRPEEVPETYGLSLLAPAPDVQERVHESLAAEQVGVERGAIEIELRRKDDGRPVWVQRWSRPEPDGRHTRTMLIDITARVLAEREKARLQQQNRYLQEEIRTSFNEGEIVGTSPAIRRVLAQIDQVGPTDATVLVLGETGTGKELVAHALHDRSRRKGGPLIKLNCAALPTGLVESELFGHEKGAFTGATDKRVGRFSLADGGTIFLDEIGEMPHEVQIKLLRVLQERSFEAVGSARTQKVDVRVIAATNRDLQKCVEQGTFRADLFYRLNVFPIVVPPLIERREDIPLLVHFFVAKYAAKIGRQIDAVDRTTMQRLQAYAWPGNIRELENVIERAIILERGTTLSIDGEVFRTPSGGPSGDHRPTPATSAASLAEAQRRHILEALRATNWVIDGESGAARRLGLQPSTLRGRLKKLGIRRHPAP